MGDEVREKLLQRQGEEVKGEEEETLKQRIWNEKKKLWVVAAPAIFTRFSTFGITVISQAFIGHLGSIQLAAFAIVITVLLRFSIGVLVSTTLILICMYIMQLGMASALETLCGQAYGAKKYEMLGVYLQRSWIVLFMTSLILLPLYIFTTPILELLGQDQVIAEDAGSISLWVIPAVFSFIPSFTCQMFLQAQSRNSIIAYLAAFAIAIHIFFSWLLTVKYQFGMNGAMASTILAFWIPNIGQLLFVTNKCPQTWKGFSFLAFKDLLPVVKLSLSSGVMLCLELWYNAILILLTGNMEDAKVAPLMLSPFASTSMGGK